MSSNRLGLDELFLSIATLVAQRGTCPRAKVGAIITLDRRIISLGYNGAPPGQAHCTEIGCQIVDGGCVRTVHAEANAIAFAAHSGSRLLGSTIYCTHSPCLSCGKLILSSGIGRVVFTEPYRDDSAMSLLNSGGLKLDLVKMESNAHPFIAFGNQTCLVCGDYVENHV